MTESGSSQPPALPRIRESAAPPRQGEQRLAIIDISGDLREVRRPTRVSGDVAARHRDGSITIKTNAGDIRVKPRADKPLHDGQKVEVELSPGRPPRQAVIRDAPRNDATHPTRDVPPPPDAVSRPANVTPPTPPAAQDTGLPPSPPPPMAARPLPEEAVTPPLKTQPLRPLTDGQAVRLLPLPAAESILPMRPNTVITNTALPLLEFNASLLAEQAPQTLLTLLMQVAEKTAALGQRPAGIQTAAPVPSVDMPPLMPVPQNTASPLPLLQQPGPLFAHMQAPPAIIMEQASPLLASSKQANTLLTALTTSPSSPLVLPQAGTVAMPLITSSAFTGENRPEMPLSRRLDVRVQLAESSGVRMIMPDGSAIPKLAVKTSIPPGPVGAMQADVAGFTLSGLPVLSLDLPGSPRPQNFIMQYNAANIDTGNALILMPQPGGPTFAAALPPPAQAWPLLSNGAWPVMDEVVASLKQTAPQAMTQLAATTPNPANPAQLPTAALLFIAAVRGGDVGGWLSERALDALRRAGKGDAINRIGRDFAGINRTSSEPVTQDWRALPLPLYWGGDIHKTVLWFRQGQGGDQDEADGKSTRFLFDLDMSRMGAVQLDGFVRGQRIDLVIRTIKPMSEAMRQIMRRTYFNAVDQAGFTGELSFQHRPEQFVKIEVRQGGGDVVA